MKHCYRCLPARIPLRAAVSVMLRSDDPHSQLHAGADALPVTARAQPPRHDRNQFRTQLSQLVGGHFSELVNLYKNCTVPYLSCCLFVHVQYMIVFTVLLDGWKNEQVQRLACTVTGPIHNEAAQEEEKVGGTHNVSVRQ